MLKVCNNWKSFHEDIENIIFSLIKNAYSPFLINKVIKKYLDYKFSSTQNQLKDKSDVHYFKLPDILYKYISYKGPIPDDLKSFLVYKFLFASCSSSYVGQNSRHFKTRVEEHIKKDNKSHIFKQLHSTAI